MSKAKDVDHYVAVLRDQIEERPYQALAVAAGVGFVVGADLWRHALRSLASIGGRIAVTAVLSSLAEQTALSSSRGMSHHKP